MNAAVVGLGPHGKRILQVLSNLPGLKCSGIVDRSEAALAAADAPADVRRCTSLSELVAQTPIDLICIATNAPSHTQLALEAIQLGIKRVLVEKPMACSIDECRTLIQAAKENGVRLVVDHSRRHAPIYRWLREKIRSGDWGQMRSVWIQRPGIGLGCLGTHSFDLACFLFDEVAQTASAWVDPPVGKNPRGAQFVDPGGLVVLTYLANRRAVIAQIEDGAGPMSVEIDLTGARIRLDEKSGEVEIIERDLTVIPGPNRPAVMRKVLPPDGMSGKTDMIQMTSAIIGELAGDGELECDPIHGLVSIEILVAAHLSQQRANCPVKLTDLSDADRAIWLPVT